MLMRMWRKESPHILLVGLQIDEATMESKMEISQKTRNRSYNPAVPILGTYLKKTKSLI